MKAMVLLLVLAAAGCKGGGSDGGDQNPRIGGFAIGTYVESDYPTCKVVLDGDSQKLSLSVSRSCSIYDDVFECNGTAFPKCVSMTDPERKMFVTSARSFSIFKSGLTKVFVKE